MSQLLRSPRFWVPAVSLGAVLWLLYLDLERTSPGPISSTHAQVPQLLESSSCEICHGGFSETLAEACSSCHLAIAEDLETHTGFHGTLTDVDPADCGLCHQEHHGEEFPLVNRRSFALANLATREAFDHAALDFTLEGRHAELGCRDCHANADVLMLPRGEQRFLGLERACVACHEDVHQGQIVRDCAACHGQAHPFGEVAVFEHASFVAEGPHLGPGCADCHEPGTEHSVETLAGTDPPLAERSCAACHESPHTPSFLVAAADLGDMRTKRSCEACHAAAHNEFAGHGGAMPTALHAASGFPLVEPHRDLACDACHATDQDMAAATFDGRFPGREADNCAGCHADVHAGQFDGGPFSSCLDCHDRHSFSPAAFDLEQHNKTSFELEGSHAGVACSACHLETSPGDPRLFAGTSSACADCHVDAHRGAFAESCDACHGTHLFQTVAIESFDHSAFTTFPLEGAHARIECEACHRRSPAPDEGGRRFGFVEEIFGSPVDACATCHTDPHGGAFEREGLPARVAGRSGCARCHVEEAFTVPAVEGFDHGLWTGYALEGAHSALSCAACHERRPSPDARGRTLGRIDEVHGTPVDACATCHTDAHRGAFDAPELPATLAGREGCARCHTTRSFQELHPGAFEHERWTGYPIAGQHASLDCSACHEPGTDPRGATILGAAAGNSCSDCHADPHAGQFAQAGRTDCARCHEAAGALLFDHQRDARFTLDEAHRELDCATCHVPWPLPGGREAVRYKPLGVECADCHGPRGGGQ